LNGQFRSTRLQSLGIVLKVLKFRDEFRRIGLGRACGAICRIFLVLFFKLVLATERNPVFLAAEIESLLYLYVIRL
jgi:hypothetical protein